MKSSQVSLSLDTLKAYLGRQRFKTFCKMKGYVVSESEDEEDDEASSGSKPLNKQEQAISSSSTPSDDDVIDLSSSSSSSSDEEPTIPNPPTKDESDKPEVSSTANDDELPIVVSSDESSSSEGTLSLSSSSEPQLGHKRGILSSNQQSSSSDSEDESQNPLQIKLRSKKSLIHPQELGSCVKCQTRFTSLTHLSRHVDLCRGKKMADLTSVLQEDKEDQDELRVEYNGPRKPGKDVKYSCYRCPQWFKTQVELTIHTTVHTNSPILRCHLCSFRTTQANKFLRHAKIH